MHSVLIYAMLFIFGAMMGWIIELVFRRCFSAKKWINPGFLNGPYLPLYGFGTVIMYAVCSIPIAWYWLSLIIAVMMTVIEYIAGIIFIKGMHIKLWDYSKRPGNIQGIICPLFSVMWAVVGIGFQFLIYPLLVDLAILFNGHITTTFILGIVYGIFFVDVGLSLHVATKIRSFAKDIKETVAYERVKLFIAEREKDHKSKRSFLFPFKSKKTFKENLELYKAHLSKMKQAQIEGNENLDKTTATNQFDVDAEIEQLNIDEQE